MQSIQIEYYDLILDYIGGYSMGAPECIQQVDDTYDIGFYRRERAPELNLQDYPYLTIPHCLTPMDMTALEVSDDTAAESGSIGSAGTGCVDRVCGYRDQL